MHKIAWIVSRFELLGNVPTIAELFEKPDETKEHIVLLPATLEFETIFDTVAELFGKEAALDLIRLGVAFIKTKNYMCFEDTETNIPIIEFKRIAQA